MEVTPEIKRLIYAGAATHQIRDRVRSGGGLTLRDEGVLLALEGRTTLEEILRVTQLETELDDAAPPTPASTAASAQPKEAAA
jgi:hypothetical protein